MKNILNKVYTLTQAPPDITQYCSGWLVLILQSAPLDCESVILIYLSKKKFNQPLSA